MPTRHVGRPRIKPAVNFEVVPDAKVYQYVYYRQRADGSYTPVNVSYAYAPREPVMTERAKINEVRDTVQEHIKKVFKDCPSESAAVDIYAAIDKILKAHNSQQVTHAETASPASTTDDEFNPKAPASW